MRRSCTLLSSLLLLISGSSSGECRPQQAGERTLDADNEKVQLVEAVKAGILNSLGMDKEPEITQKASERELSRMYRLYWERLREMRGNSSQWTGGTTSKVLFPATGPIKAPQGEEPLPLPPGQHMQWYRAVFHKNPSIQMEAILTRAELKVSRHSLIHPTHSDLRQIKVQVKRLEVGNLTGRTHMDPHVDVSLMQNVTMDISTKVTKWMRTDDTSLVVNVRMAMGEGDPTISLELDLIQPKAAKNRRLPRSNMEDECNEQGWCCRKSINVSFKDIGWTDWIVAPTEYTMHLCDGTCPHNYKPATMHTQVKSRLHQILKGGSPRPCCVPASYEPMVLMYYDSRGKLKLTPFDDLIVTKCHCA
ncbi:growth/differentiation factor 8 [Phycodurus eques]|uniref:growth/differentiation factor 8 n=1 Tax=Phycodurus eques TaxID=693459 RepID=UPI002ACD8CA3|nr:growth/differentiation factor 8 [Phycodurus eques]